MIEDAIQTKLAAIVTSPTLQAPLRADYPTEGQVSTGDLPLALTWMMDSTVDDTGAIRDATYETTFYVVEVGQDTWNYAKIRALALLAVVEAAFRVTNTNAYIQTSPTVRVIPGSVTFTGVEAPVTAPDGGQFHGFIMTLNTLTYLDSVDACAEE